MPMNEGYHIEDKVNKKAGKWKSMNSNVFDEISS